VITTRQSPWSVEETIQRLESTIAGKGLKLFALFNHSGEAEAHGLALRSTKVVVFGSPEAGTPVMQTHPLVALDLPLKVLVWDDNGETLLAYAPPAELAAATDSTTNSLRSSPESTPSPTQPSPTSACEEMGGAGLEPATYGV
jgi:uncharacterized protein (DUF302 family)